jgi:hypothetical protein
MPAAHAQWSRHGAETQRICGRVSPSPSAIIGALFWPFFTVAFPRRPIRATTGTAKHERNHRQHDLVCFNAAFGAIALFGSIAVAMKRQKLQTLWPWVLLWPLYQLLVTIAAWCAVVELRRNPFGWAKTQHGLAKSSRGRPATL